MKTLLAFILLVSGCNGYALNAPSNLTAQAASQSQINLAWKDNSGKERGFQVFQSRDNVNFGKVGTVGRGVTHYQASGLMQGINYYFKVRAYTWTTASGWSNTAGATPLPAPSPTPTPSPTASPSPSATPSVSPTPSPGSGIASRYPGDKNLGSDPDVILFDDFESYTSPSQLTSKWSGAGAQQNLRIATEAGNYYGGSKGLEMTLPISTSEVSNALNKTLPITQDVAFIRAYEKFDAGYSVTTSGHNGLRLSAKYPGAGIIPPADGTGFFLFLLQNNIQGSGRPGEVQPGYAHLYAYWPKQRSQWGDHWFSDGFVLPSSAIGNKGEWLAYPSQYPDFKALPNWQPQRGKWYCYELMVKANTPGQNDGEVKYWIDGRVVGDFPDLFLRSISTLKIDTAVIVMHAIHSERVNKKWYDNVVIAKKYIGPMSGASPSPSVSPTPLVTPSPTPTATPSPTPSPSPSPTASSTPFPPASPTPSPTVSPTPTATTSPSPSSTPTATASATSSVTAYWDDDGKGNGYKIYYGKRAGVYDAVIDVGRGTSYTVTNLVVGQGYYFALTAYNSTGESGKSPEVSYLPMSARRGLLYFPAKLPKPHASP